MSKLETSVYIVGAKRTWQLRENYIKTILASIFFLFLGLGGALAYQSIMHLQVIEEMETRYEREQQKNEKLQSILKDLRQRVVDRRAFEVNNSLYNSPALEELMRKNGEQTKQIELQKAELDTLKTETRQLVQELQQLRYQQSNSEKRISVLQQANQKLEDKSAQLALSLEESIQRASRLQIAKKQLEDKSAQLALRLKNVPPPQEPPLTTTATTSQRPTKKEQQTLTQQLPSATDVSTSSQVTTKPPIFIDDLQLRKTGNDLSVKFKLRNQSKVKQQGRLGVFVVSAQNRSVEIPFSMQDTDSFSIRNFKTIDQKYQKWNENSFLRIVAWNKSKVRILDQYHSLTNLN